jgi:hypothetical protein
MLVKKKERVKPKASKGVKIMDRDIDIFRILSSGAAEMKYIYSLYQKSVLRIKDSNLAEGSSDQAKKVKTGKAGFLRRLWVLQKKGYLKSRRYQIIRNQGHFVLCGLTQNSSDILCEHSGYRPEGIRMSLPPASHVSHDFQVSDVVRAIKREGGRFPYEYLIIDEYWQRKTAFKKIQSFSDVFVILRLNSNGREINGKIHVEIDNNTIVPNYVREKVRKMTLPTFILCTTKKRIEILQHNFKTAYDLAVPHSSDKRAENKNPDKNLINVFFALTSDFCASNGGGFINTKFETIAGGKAKAIQL